MKRKPRNPFDQSTLQLLVKRAGFCSWGHPKEAAHFLHKLLQLTPFYKDYKAVERLFPSDGCYLHVLYLASDLDLIEHGGGVGGSWCRDEGEEVKAALKAIDWNKPAELSDVNLATELRSSKCQPDWTRREKVSYEAAFCGCGRPNAALAFIKAVFDKPLSIEAEHLVALIPDLGIRQFLLYQLFRLMLIDHEWKLTEHGSQFVENLAKVKSVLWEDEEDEEGAEDGSSGELAQ